MNNKFTIFDTLTGRVLYGGTADNAGIMVEEGQSLYTEEAYINGWLDNGVHFTQPESPSVFHVFDWVSKQWFDPRTLQDLKATKNSYINIERLKANQSTFTFNGKQIAVDPLSRGDIDATHGIILLTNAMPVDWVGGWKAVDNTFVAIPDKATWESFYTAMVSQGSINFAHSQALKAQLAAATTIEEIEAITW